MHSVYPRCPENMKGWELLKKHYPEVIENFAFGEWHLVTAFWQKCHMSLGFFPLLIIQVMLMLVHVIANAN